MKKTINSASIIGRVYNHNLQKRVTGPQSKAPGTQFIMGDLDIAVDEDGLNVIPVHFSYVTEGGRKQKTYDILSQIIDDPNLTWVQAGKENALKVSISSQVAVNEFYIKDEKDEDKLISNKRVEGGFVNEVFNEADLMVESERNKFIVDMLITGVKYNEEVVKENGDVFPEYAVIKGYIFDFRGMIYPVEFRAEKEAGIQFFMANDGVSEPNFRKVWGHIDSLTIKKSIVEESAFGEASVHTVTSTVKKWVIDGCAANPYIYGDNSVLDDETMIKKKQERNIYLADIKRRQEEFKANKNKSTSNSTLQTQNKPAFTVKEDTGFTF